MYFSSELVDNNCTTENSPTEPMAIGNCFECVENISSNDLGYKCTFVIN